MADCYPSDFVGPLPPGGYYCNTPSTPTVFGSINSILAQAAGTASQIRRTLDQYKGNVNPQPVAILQQPGHTTLALLILAVAIGIIVFLIIRR